MNSKVSFDVLKKFSPFDSLADEYLQQILPHTKVTDIQKSQLIFKRGRIQPALYYLLEGQVSLVDSSFSSKQLSAGEKGAGFALNEINSPTKFSAVAQGDVRLLEVSQAPLDQIMAWSQSVANEGALPEEDGRFNAEGFVVEDSDWIAHLLGSPMFARIPPANLQSLFQRFQARDVAAGETIVKGGEVGDFFYVVAKGKAQVFPVADVPAEPVYLRDGDFFGEEALVGETTRNASVKMVTNGTLMALGKEDFKALLQQPLLSYVDSQELSRLKDDHADVQLIDVRLPIEYRHLHLNDTINIPLHKLRNRLSALERGCLYVITDDAGARSEVAAQLMIQDGQHVMILRDASQYYPATVN